MSGLQSAKTDVLIIYLEEKYYNPDVVIYSKSPTRHCNC